MGVQVTGLLNGNKIDAVVAANDVNSATVPVGGYLVYAGDGLKGRTLEALNRLGDCRDAIREAGLIQTSVSELGIAISDAGSQQVTVVDLGGTSAAVTEDQLAVMWDNRAGPDTSSLIFQTEIEKLLQVLNEKVFKPNSWPEGV
jgi:hypothetical protein